MNSYYQAQRRACDCFYMNLAQNYRFGMNGFLEDPADVYDDFVPVVDRSGPVLDIGCGNGHLLRHLMDNCKNEIVPYGIDFRSAAIAEANRIVLAEYRDNFRCTDALSWSFDVLFSYVLADPVIVHDDDRADFIELAERHLGSCGKLILYTYRDGLSKLKINSLCLLAGICATRCSQRVMNDRIEIQEYGKAVEDQ